MWLLRILNSYLSASSHFRAVSVLRGMSRHKSTKSATPTKSTKSSTKSLWLGIHRALFEALLVWLLRILNLISLGVLTFSSDPLTGSANPQYSDEDARRQITSALAIVISDARGQKNWGRQDLPSNCCSFTIMG